MRRGRNTPQQQRSRETEKVGIKAKTLGTTKLSKTLGSPDLQKWLLYFLAGVLVVFVLFWLSQDKPQVNRKSKKVDETLPSVLTTDQNLTKPLVYETECGFEYPEVPGCTPRKCARIVLDNFVTEDEVNTLISLAERAMQYGGGSGGPTIFDTSSGTLSKDTKFINLYKYLQVKGEGPIFTDDDKLFISSIQNRVFQFVRQHFSTVKTELASPSFFSRITNAEPVTEHDEYWHDHVDTQTYGTFIYTSLLYLNDYGKDYEGGEFEFVDKETRETRLTIHPKKGRLNVFTSGTENPHHVRQVISGVRYAWTIAFTCSK
eukprot:TRINITY_DN9302_c0_g1_i1.p1 TRINITY_DN9302_c0_g1~~TRINITY_DN9302_c0_g1_i1.p1  ORF type:complete len:317 (-),score=33.57 TRINITY_DN9302_c0_g1_i1:42-992(-)